MGINECEVENDQFEYDIECCEYYFPCCCCKFRHGKCTDNPCSICGHNLNAVSQG
jgi:hypothetical protein